MTTLTRTLARSFAAVLVTVLSAGTAGVFAAEPLAFVPPAPVLRTLPNGLATASAKRPSRA